MNSLDRPEFDKHLAILCAGMDVPTTEERKEAYWRGLQHMPLGVFVRTVDFVLAKEAWSKIPKPGQLWDISKRMRAAAAPPPPVDDGFRGDAWDAAANRYLLGYLATRFKSGRKFPGKPASYEAMRAPLKDLRALGLDEHNLDASSEFIAHVHKLVAAKNAWASDMRDIAVNGAVPVATQQTVWREYLARADV